MVPQHLVALDAFPLTPSGKVDRRALPAVAEVQAVEGLQLTLPRTPVEEILLEIWRDVLRLPYIDTHAHFFELGGHSLLATQVVTRISVALQIELPLRTLFETPVLAELAERIEHQMRAQHNISLPPLLPVSREQELPLSFAQQRLWFLDQLHPGDPTYNLPLAVTIRGALNVAALEQSLGEVIKRHEALRTTFVERDGHAVQCIVPYQFQLEQEDLHTLPATSKTAETLRLVQMEAETAFDLRQVPLLRARLLRLDDSEYLLLITLHHIISDGWSLGILARELTILYAAFARNEPSPLPELALQYADFAVWQRQWLRENVLDEHLRYWTKQLRGAPSLQLPTDRPRQPTSSNEGASYDFHLSAELSRELLLLSQREGVTLFMTLLAAFQTLLYRHTQQEDIIVGTDIANRTHIETEKLIGFFVNLLALRTSFYNRPSFQELLHRVQRTVLDAYAHQDAPFEYLVDALEPGASLQRMPLVQVLFVLQNTPTFNVELPGLTFSSFEHPGPTPAKFNLAVFMHESPAGLQGTVVFRRDLFDESTIATWMQRFEVLLQSIVRQIDTPVNALEMHTVAEHAKTTKKKFEQKRGIRSARREQFNIPDSDTRQGK
jgi:acyl carrier protein